jgi:phenylpropionate dioxygenase-like ring-hydroxylating dioxygenase large terminal subunit
MESIPDDVYARLIAHIRNRTTDLADDDLRVPVANFVSESRAAAERSVFRRQFLVAAHASEVPQPGSFVARDILGSPVIIVRQGDGDVKSFFNICRHRGGRVEFSAAGVNRGFACRYHGWSYDLAGALRNVPYESTYSGIDHACNGLVPITTEERHGLIWLNFSQQPAACVADYLGPQVEARFEAFSLAGTIILREQSFILDINWKLVVDGALDIRHAPFLHKGGVDEFVATNHAAWEDYGRHGQLFTARKKSVDRIRSGVEVGNEFRYFSTAMMLFPNTIVIAAPDHVEFWTIWPTDSPRTCVAHIRCLVQADILTESIKERINRSWEILHHAATAEDWPMASTIQANAQAKPEGSYLYGRGEICTQHLHRQLDRELGTQSRARVMTQIG